MWSMNVIHTRYYEWKKWINPGLLLDFFFFTVKVNMNPRSWLIRLPYKKKIGQDLIWSIRNLFQESVIYSGVEHL